jgi:uncharacterized protein YbjT (DUF2867 family)
MNLVIGATGSLGGLISHRLLKANAPVRALVREGSDYSSLQTGGAEIALGDLKNPRSLERGCVGAKRIIATATAAARGGNDTIEAVDQQGYASLVEAAQAAGVSQFVFVSAYGFGLDSPLALARAKAATEKTLKASGLNYAILQPALFMEAWISMVLGAQLQLGPKVVIMGDPDQPVPFIGIANVADLAIAVLDNEEAENVSVPLSAQAVSYRQIIDWIDEVTGRSIAIEVVPPGTEIPGLPPTVLELWAWLAAGAIEPIETVGVAVRFGLALESPKSFINRTFGKSSII